VDANKFSTLTDQEILKNYHNFKQNGVKSFASWWGFKLIEFEMKKRKLFDNTL